MRRRATWLLSALALVACKKDPPPAPAATSATPGPEASTPAPSAPAPSADAPPAGAESAGVVRLEAEVGVGDELGYAVATADDRAVVTAYKRKGKTEEAHPGAVFVFKLGADKPVREAELTVDGSHQMGNAVAFDGSVLLAGALYDAGKAAETGAAYAFSKEAAGWSKAQKLSGADSKADDSFGIGVALAGGALIVANSREDGGSLYTFERDKAGFVPKKPLPFRHQNGPAEAMAASGDLVVAGAPYSGKLSEQGLAFVYRRDKGALTQVAELVEPDAAETNHFGSSVAVGKATVVASSEKQLTVFTESGGQWKLAQRFTPPVTTGLADAPLALSDDRLAVGFHLVDAGRVLLYKRQNGEWKLERTVTAPDGKNEDWFGYSVALSDKHLVIGAPLAAERAGAAYLLKL
ncbi:MAG: hypothetical protein IT377_21945 [Polyangiaceae bacterium]|nr:hypothetical protein [Polyangiaceae bacterium]